MRAALGALVDVLPRRVVESEQRPIPQLTGSVRLGLPMGFSVDGRASAVVITNQLEVGLAWSSSVGDLAFTLGDHVGVWYGYIGVEGFDATGWGALNQPRVALGLPMGDVRFTLDAEAIVMLAQHVKLGDAHQILKKQVSVAGGTFTLYVENLLDGGAILYYGVGAMYAEPNYQAWIAFSDSRARIWYPRFLVGYAF